MESSLSIVGKGEEAKHTSRGKEEPDEEEQRERQRVQKIKRREEGEEVVYQRIGEVVGVQWNER